MLRPQRLGASIGGIETASFDLVQALHFAFAFAFAFRSGSGWEGLNRGWWARTDVLGLGQAVIVTFVKLKGLCT